MHVRGFLWCLQVTTTVFMYVYAQFVAFLISNLYIYLFHIIILAVYI